MQHAAASCWKTGLLELLVSRALWNCSQPLQQVLRAFLSFHAWAVT